MADNAVIDTQSFSDQAVNVASPLDDVDIVRTFATGLSTNVAPGTLLKRTGLQEGINQAVVAGVDASGGAVAITVNGIDAQDQLRSVIRAVGAGTDVTDIADVTGDFSITADDEITQASGNYSADKLIVTWLTPAHGLGEYQPWIQGTDPVAEIAGVYVGPDDLDTAETTNGLVRRFGAVNQKELTAWTAADGSTTASPTEAALMALSDQLVIPM